MMSLVEHIDELVDCVGNTIGLSHTFTDTLGTNKFRV